MDVFVVPVDGRYVVYRPLLPLAFVGNRAMADVVRVWSMPAGKSRAEIDAREGTDVAGRTVTHTLPRGSPIPAGAVCTCVEHTSCSCLGDVCPRVGHTSGGTHYWYPY